MQYIQARFGFNLLTSLWRLLLVFILNINTISLRYEKLWSFYGCIKHVHIKRWITFEKIRWNRQMSAYSNYFFPIRFENIGETLYPLGREMLVIISVIFWGFFFEGLDYNTLKRHILIDKMLCSHKSFFISFRKIP